MTHGISGTARSHVSEEGSLREPVVAKATAVARCVEVAIVMFR